MSSEFTSGTFAQVGAWHGGGSIITDEAQLSADYFFNDANALFPVEPLELWGGSPSAPQDMVPLKGKTKAIWRPDKKHVLGTVSPGYEVIPNSMLLDFAKRIESEATIDAVVVLREGAKVAFTAKLRDLEGAVVPDDTVKRYVVGYLGHDGSVGFGGMFSNTRVVCNNTLQGALHRDGQAGSGQFSIAHNAFEIAQIDKVLEQIDFARQSFPETISLYQAMQQTAVDDLGFRNFINAAYQPQARRDRQRRSSLWRRPARHAQQGRRPDGCLAARRRHGHSRRGRYRLGCVQRRDSGRGAHSAPRCQQQAPLPQRLLRWRTDDHSPRRAGRPGPGRGLISSALPTLTASQSRGLFPYVQLR
jgi:hypothetical protein